MGEDANTFVENFLVRQRAAAAMKMYMAPKKKKKGKKNKRPKLMTSWEIEEDLRENPSYYWETQTYDHPLAMF